MLARVSTIAILSLSLAGMLHSQVQGNWTGRNTTMNPMNGGYINLEFAFDFHGNGSFEEEVRMGNVPLLRLGGTYSLQFGSKPGDQMFTHVLTLTPVRLESEPGVSELRLVQLAGIPATTRTDLYVRFYQLSPSGAMTLQDRRGGETWGLERAGASGLRGGPIRIPAAPAVASPSRMQGSMDTVVLEDGTRLSGTILIVDGKIKLAEAPFFNIPFDRLQKVEMSAGTLQRLFGKGPPSGGTVTPLQDILNAAAAGAELAGVWQHDSNSGGTFEKIELTLRADGTYTAKLTVGSPFARPEAHSGTWTSTGKVVALSGSGVWPAARYDLTSFYTLR